MSLAESLGMAWAATGEGLLAGSGPAARLRDLAEAERPQWLNWSPVMFGLGIGLYFGLGFEPPLAVAALPLLVAVSLAAARPSALAPAITAALVLAALGFAAAKARTDWVRAPVIAKPLAGVEVKGFVELVEPRVTRGHRITLRVAGIEGLGASSTPVRVRIRTLAAGPALKPGDGVRLVATLAPPAAPVIPGGYDFARSAWFQRLGAVGYARKPAELAADLGPPPKELAWRAAIEGVRQRIGERVRAALPGEPGAIANALITGERGAIAPETSDAFRDSGLIHILSISGLHMVVMAGAVFWLVRLALAAVPQLALSYPIKSWAAVAAALAAFAYLMISGAAFATVRAFIMIVVAFLAVVADRPALAMRNVAISALVILALFPESLLDAGFQMSFAAVVALVAVYEALARRAREAEPGEASIVMRPVRLLSGIVVSTLVAGVAVAPFAAYHFHTSQQFAVVANLIAIPICNIIVMPAALLTLIAMPLGLEAIPLWAMGQGIEAMTWCARFASALPGAVGHIAAVPQGAFLTMVAGGLWLCLWAERWRWLGIGVFAAGAALASVPELPSVLAGRDGRLIAVRGEDGKLSAAGGRSSAFELVRWLEHDGDPRRPAAAARAEAFKCDAVGCVAKAGGHTVALARHPAALADDCAKANILVLDFPAPKGCTGAAHIVDFFALRNEGTHAFYLDDGERWRLETVAAARGVRPWSPKGTLGAGVARAQPRNARQTGRARDGEREQPAPRAEVEDEADEEWDEPE